MTSRHRQVFDTLAELKEYIRENPGAAQKKTVYKVTIRGETKYTLGNNTDGAIAAVIRDQESTFVSSIGLMDLLGI